MTTDLSQFRAIGLVSRLTIAFPERVQPAQLSDVISIRQIAEATGGASNGYDVQLFEVSCDFSMKTFDQTTFNRVLTRFDKGLVRSNAAGLARSVSQVARHTIRTSIELTQPSVPPGLNSLQGWSSFEFKSLRTLFQFKASDAPTVDEELHERIRHVLRNLTRRFRT